MKYYKALLKKEIKETEGNQKYAKKLGNKNIELLYEGRVAGLVTALRIFEKLENRGK